MAKYTLSLEDDFDFDLIGICSPKNDYRVCWSINEKLNLRLQKSLEPFMVSGKKGNITSSHSLYEWEDEENFLSYYLIQNKSQGKFLIPEKAQIDYFLVIKESGVVDVKEQIRQLQEIVSITTVIDFDPNELKSASKLIF